MFKRTSILVALLIFCMVSGASAGTDLLTIGTSDTQIVNIDSAGIIVGLKRTLEAVTTDDTITALESGTIYAVSATPSAVTLTLPTAAAGLEYTALVADGTATVAGVVRLKPQSTDMFVGCVSSTTATTFALGDILASPDASATGDTVTIIGASAKWYCVDRIGTWRDSGQN